MALVLSETKVYSRISGRNFFIFKWDNLDEADVSPVSQQVPSHLKFKVKVIGSFGTGGHVKLEGSIDGLTWSKLKDSTGSEIDLSAAGEAEVLNTHVFRYIRPLITAGTTVDVDVFLLVM